MKRSYDNIILLSTIILFSTISFLFFPKEISAYIAEPNEGTYTKGTKVTINLLASLPEAEVNAVSIRLEALGMVINNYTQPEGWTLVIGDCGEGELYTSTSVCVSMAKSELIEGGESLGIVEATIDTDEEATLTKIEGSAYSDGVVMYTSTGEIVDFNKKETSIQKVEDDVFNLKTIIYITGGVLLIAVMLIVFLIAFQRYKSRMSSKARVISFILGFGSMIVFGGIVVFAVQKEQSIKDSSAANAVYCDVQTCFINNKTQYVVLGDHWCEQIASPNPQICHCGPSPDTSDKCPSSDYEYVKYCNSSGSTYCQGGGDAECVSGQTRVVCDYSLCNSGYHSTQYCNAGKWNHMECVADASCVIATTTIPPTQTTTPTTPPASGTCYQCHPGAAFCESYTSTSACTTDCSSCQSQPEQVTCYKCTGNLYDDANKCESKTFSGSCDSGWSQSDPCQGGTKKACAAISLTAECGAACGPNWNGGGQNQGRACSDMDCVFVKGKTSSTCSTSKSIYQQTFAKGSFACVNPDVATFESGGCGKTDNGYDTKVITLENFNKHVANNCAEPTPTPTDTPTPTTTADSVNCGPLDENEDGIMNVLDLGAFVLVYGKSCSDTVQYTTGCKGKDGDISGNTDGKIDLIDLGKFALVYPKLKCENL